MIKSLKTAVSLRKLQPMSERKRQPVLAICPSLKDFVAMRQGIASG